MHNKRKEDPICDYEQHFLLRLPEDIATNLREELKNNPSILKDNFTIKINDDMRTGQLRYNFEQLYGRLVDLPCIVDVLKNNSSALFYKSGSVSQMFVCTRDTPESGKNYKKSEKLLDSNRENMWSHGVCPPFKNVRKRRFRKALKHKYVEMPEVENEVLRLLRADCEAKDVSWEIQSISKKDAWDTFGENEETEENKERLEEKLFGEEISSEEERGIEIDPHLSSPPMEVREKHVLSEQVKSHHNRLMEEVQLLTREVEELSKARVSDSLKERFTMQINEKNRLLCDKFEEINAMRRKWDGLI